MTVPSPSYPRSFERRPLRFFNVPKRSLIYDAKGRLKKLKNALKRYRTGINLRMLRDAEGTLDPWNAGGTQGGRRSKERGRDGHGHGTKTLASLY